MKMNNFPDPALFHSLRPFFNIGRNPPSVANNAMCESQVLNISLVDQDGQECRIGDMVTSTEQQYACFLINAMVRLIQSLPYGMQEALYYHPQILCVRDRLPFRREYLSPSGGLCMNYNYANARTQIALKRLTYDINELLGARQIIHKFVTPEQMITSMVEGLAHILTDVTFFRSMVEDIKYNPEMQLYFQNRAAIVTKFSHDLFASYTSEHRALKGNFYGDASTLKSMLERFPRPLGHLVGNAIVMRSKIAAQLLPIVMTDNVEFITFELSFPKTTEVIENFIEIFGASYFEKVPITILISGTPADEFFAQYAGPAYGDFGLKI